MKKMKNKIALFLSIVMCLSLCSVSVFAAKPKLTTKKVNLNIGTSKTVALKKAKKKVKWKVTKGKKNVKIKAIGRNKVKITGKKVGKATIKATYGKKKYFINVNVKKNRNKIVKPTTKVEPTTKNEDGNVVPNPTTVQKETTTASSDLETPTTTNIQNEATTNNTEITTNENETTTKTVEETTTKRKPIYEEY